MKKFLEQVSALLIGEHERLLALHELKLEFVKKEKEMIRNIALCKKSGGIIGIYSAVLGKGMILCSIQQILQDKTIVIRPIDPNGTVTHKTIIDISEITCICPFNQIYEHPKNDSAMGDENISSQLGIFQNVN